MRITPLIISILLTSFCANTQTFQWATSVGSANTEYSLSVTTDAAGNTYTTGSYNGSVDFDPGIGTYTMTSLGLGDIFIQKLDPNGNFIWAKSMGGIANDFGRSIQTDALGNVYTTGNFNGSSVDFNPGSGTSNLSSSGGDDIFVQKLDANGNFIWAKRMGGASEDQGYSIVIDATGNCYTTGVFRATTDFDPGAGTSNLTPAGYGDVFIQKMDANGNFLWVKAFGGTMNDESYSSCLDGFGNIYTTGYFQGTADFDPGTSQNNLSSAGITDVFVQKMDINGNFLWVRGLGGTSFDYSFAIDTDPIGNVYTTGYFIESADFDPGVGSFNLTSQGNADVFVQKMNSAGNFMWAKSIGGSGYDYGNAMCVDGHGDVYITGQFEGTVDFNPGSGTNNFTSLGGTDVFVQKMNSAGTFLRAKTFGGNSSDRGQSIMVDNSENIIVTGSYQGTVNFNPPSGTNTATSSGNDDIFVEKISQCYSNPGTTVITACDSYTWIDGITYSASNNSATITLNGTPGCDQIITLNLTINYSNSSTDTITACDSYTWINGITYSASTHTPTWTLPNAAGCDSVITLNLTINQSDNLTDVVTTCDSLTWIDGITYYTSTNTPTWTLMNAAGCDSIINLNLTILNNTGVDVQTACDSLIWIDGITYYTSTNSPTDTLVNSNGCDSIVTLNLTIIPSIPTVIENSFSLPSDPNICMGEIAITVSGNNDFELSVDNNTSITSSGYSLITNLCPGIHDLNIINYCGDTTQTQFVIPIDSNYVFNNPFIDSLAQDSLGTTLTDCDIYYAGIDTAFIDSIWANGNTVNVIWNIVDANGSNFDTTSYVLDNGNGVYWLQLSVFCPVKAMGDYFTVTESIYFEDGTVSSAGITDWKENNIALYPNPTNDLVTIAFDGNEAKLTIYDAQGKLIRTSSIISGLQVSLHDVQTGVYFFEVTTEKGSVVKRVVKN